MKVRRKQREKRVPAVRLGLLVLSLALCFVSVACISGVVRIIDDWTSDLPDVTAFDYEGDAGESVMWAADGETKLAQFQLEKREPVSLEEVGAYAVRATIDVEDARFYEHNGVDPRGIVRAVLNNVTGGETQGASTITMQLVRNTLLLDEMTDVSLERKVREMALAVEMEKNYSKDEILRFYLNTVNYGDGCYGIQAAAQNYYQVNASELTIAQAATLAGIPQSPTYNNPVDYPDQCLARRNVVLDRMLGQGDITQEEHDAAVAEDLGLNMATDTRADGIAAYPYFTSYVRDLLLDEDSDFAVSYEDLFQGGLTIHTTLDPAMQESAEQTCAEQNAMMTDNIESVLVAVDPSTGYIKALVGGRDYDTDQFNIATQGARPVGSSFKAFTLATAIEEGIDPETKIDCSNPLTMDTGDKLYNFGQQDLGTRTIKSATAVSSNTGYYRLIEQVGVSKVISMAKRLGISSELTNRPIITLGTENISPLEMAEAYSCFASGGIHRDPVAVTRIENSEGEVIYEAEDTGKRVLSAEVAGAVTKVLRGVFESSEGTAYGYGLSNGQPVAGKTGTSTDWRDLTLVGYTPTLCCATWIGARDYSPTDESLNCDWLFSTFMSRALEGTAVQDFPETADPPYKNSSSSSGSSTGSSASGTSSGQQSGSGSSTANTVGKTLSEATSLLGTGQDVYMTEEYSNTVASGTVIRQQTQSDGSILLIVSAGPQPTGSGGEELVIEEEIIEYD